MVRPNGRVSCVIFDFGGVISRPQDPRFFATLAARLGVGAGPLRDAYRLHRTDYDRGSLDGHGYWERVLNGFPSETRRVAVAELVRLDTESWTSINEPVYRLIENLSASGYRLGLLSNMPWDMGRAVRQQCAWLGRLFDSVTFSCEIGLVKPEPGIYARALASLDVEPQSCLFADDTEVNVTAAREAGMSAVHFRSPADIQAAL